MMNKLALLEIQFFRMKCKTPGAQATELHCCA
jgi:hypothetical protein